MIADGGTVAGGKRPITALVADDHEFVRNWVSGEMLKHLPDSSVHVSATATDAVAKAISLRPDLVLMDIDFENDPDLNGIEAAEKIWQKHPTAAIVIVSGNKGEIYVRHLYKVMPPDGTYGYILKDKLAQHFQNAIGAVLSGDCWVDPDIIRIANRLSRSNYSLTDNEYEALICIALGLSDSTAGKVLCLSEKAIQARLQLLYSKLGIPPKGHQDAGLFNSRCRAVWYAHQRGLVTDSELKAWAAEIGLKAKEVGIDLTAYGQ